MAELAVQSRVEPGSRIDLRAVDPGSDQLATSSIDTPTVVPEGPQGEPGEDLFSAPVSAAPAPEVSANPQVDPQAEFAASLQSFEASLDDFETGKLGLARSFARAEASNLESTREALRTANSGSFNPFSEGFWSRRSGLRDALVDKVQAGQQLLDQHEEKVTELETARSLSREFAATAQGFASRGMMDEANAALQQANALLEIDGTVDTSAYREALKDSSRQLSAADQYLTTTEKVARGVQTGAVVVGATIATGGLATGTMAVGAGVGTLGAGGVGLTGAALTGTAVAGGTSVGLVGGLASGTAENTRMVIEGDRTVAEGISDTFDQTGRMTKEALIASASTAVGLQGGTALTSRFAANAAPLTQQMVTSVVTAGITAATSSGVHITDEVIAANNEFSALYAGSNLSELQLQQAYGDFMEVRGLQGDQIAWRLFLDTSSGAAGGAIGGVGNALRSGMNPATNNALRSFAIGGGEVVADVTVGLGATALSNEGLTTENAITQVTSALMGTAVAHASANRTQVTEDSPAVPQPQRGEEVDARIDAEVDVTVSTDPPLEQPATTTQEAAIELERPSWMEDTVEIEIPAELRNKPAETEGEEVDGEVVGTTNDSASLNDEVEVASVESPVEVREPTAEEAPVSASEPEAESPAVVTEPEPVKVEEPVRQHEGPRILNSGHTEQGRLLPAQSAFVEHLVNRGVEHPVLVDVGIGDGAATVRDLARALHAAGVKEATIVAIDADKNRVLAGELITRKAGLPEGINVVFRLGDITAPAESPLSVTSILSDLQGNGTIPRKKADVATSSNLINAFGDPADRALARQSLNAAIAPDGIVGIGSGDGHLMGAPPDLRFVLYDSWGAHSETGRLDFSAEPNYHLQSDADRARTTSRLATDIDAATHKPFDGMTSEQIESEAPPPTGIPVNADTKGPYTADSLADRYHIFTKVDRNDLQYPEGAEPTGNAKEAKIEMYYHNYGPDGDHPNNWRYNVTVGRKDQYVAIRPSMDDNGPFQMGDLVLLPRGPQNPVEVANAANDFAAGRATPEQTEMLLTTWKGMEQLHMRQEALLEQGLISPEEMARIDDIMQRGHFIPGSYERGS